MTKLYLPFFVLILLVSSCSNTDIDNDGISNQDEIKVYHTNPYSPDSDGDGFSDYKEMFELSFDPESDISRFNPLIADVPTFEIKIVSEPDIEYIMSKNGSEETSKSLTEGESTTDSYSVTNSNELTTSTESNWGVSVDVGISNQVVIKPTGGATLTKSLNLGSSYGKSWSNSSSVNYSTDRTNELAKNMEKTQQDSKSEGYEITGGGLSLIVDIINSGHVAFTVENMSLSTLLFNPAISDSLKPVCTLEPDTKYGSFPEQTLAPEGKWESVVFSTDNLKVGEVEKLIFNPTGLLFKTSNFEITGNDDSALPHAETDIQANTAVIVIDHGDINIPVEKYRVCTTAKRDKKGKLVGITLQEVFNTVLRQEYTTESVAISANDKILKSNTIVSIGNTKNDLENNKFWVVDSSIDEINGYEYDFNNVILRAGDYLSLVYVKDDDKDKVGLREERIYGSSDHEVDTDGDGLSDYDEIREGWKVLGSVKKSSPYLADTDFDGLSDIKEKELGTNPLSRDSDKDKFSDLLEVNKGTDPLSVTNAQLRNLILSDNVTLTPPFSKDRYEYTAVCSKIDKISFTPMIDSAGSTIKINNSTVEPDKESSPLKLALGENNYILDVSSEGDLENKKYSIKVINTTQNLSLSSVGITTMDNKPIHFKEEFNPSNFNYSLKLNADKIKLKAAALNPSEDVVVYNYIKDKKREVDLSEDHYTLQVPIGSSQIIIRVTSFNSKISKDYVINTVNELNPGSNLQLLYNSDDDGKYITGIWDQSDDPRSSKYYVVRQENKKQKIDFRNIAYKKGVNIDDNSKVVDIVENDTFFKDSKIKYDKRYIYFVYAYYKENRKHYYSLKPINTEITTPVFVPEIPKMVVKVNKVTIKNVKDSYTEDPDFKLKLGYRTYNGKEDYWEIQRAWGDWEIEENKTKTHEFKNYSSVNIPENRDLSLKWFVKEEDCGTYWNVDQYISYNELKEIADDGKKVKINNKEIMKGDRVYTRDEERSYKDWKGTKEYVKIEVEYYLSVEYEIPYDGSDS